MAHLTEYQELKKQAKELYTSLTLIRKNIKDIENDLLRDLRNQNIDKMNVTINNTSGSISIKQQKRYQSLTLSIVREKINICMKSRFGNQVNQEQLESFVESMTQEVWAGRTVKQEEKIILKIP
jgi:hypothetical protein